MSGVCILSFNVNIIDLLSWSRHLHPGGEESKKFAFFRIGDIMKSSYHGTWYSHRVWCEHQVPSQVRCFPGRSDNDFSEHQWKQSRLPHIWISWDKLELHRNGNRTGCHKRFLNEFRYTFCTVDRICQNCRVFILVGRALRPIWHCCSLRQTLFHKQSLVDDLWRNLWEKKL